MRIITIHGLWWHVFHRAGQEYLGDLESRTVFLLISQIGIVLTTAAFHAYHRARAITKTRQAKALEYKEIEDHESYLQNAHYLRASAILELKSYEEQNH